jgi:hypothetical protein
MNFGIYGIEERGMDEIESLRGEVQHLKNQRKLAEIEKHEDRISGRKLPPLSTMTRTQKRYFLEPWYTVGMVVSGALATIGLLVGAILWSYRYMWVGIVMILVASAFATAKFWHQDKNTATEGQLQAPMHRDYDR